MCDQMYLRYDNDDDPLIKNGVSLFVLPLLNTIERFEWINIATNLNNSVEQALLLHFDCSHDRSIDRSTLAQSELILASRTILLSWKAPAPS